MSSIDQSGTAIKGLSPNRLVDSSQSERLRSIWVSVNRPQLFCGLFILALVNGLADRASRGLSSFDLEALVAAVLSVSVVVWFSCFAALSLVLREQDRQPIRRADVLVALIVLALVVVPLKEPSWFALAALAMYVIATSQAGSPMR